MAVLLLAGAPAAGAAQIAERIPDQQAGALESFGESALRIRGGPRIEVEARMEGFAAILQMQPAGTLVVRQVSPVRQGKQGFDVRRPDRTYSGTTRVPFVIRGTDPYGPGSGRTPQPPPPSGPTPVDGILVVLANVPLDSATLAERLAGLPVLETDSVASQIGRLLAPSGGAWAAYYRRR